MTGDDYLSDDEVAHLTEIYRDRKKQIAWLRANRIPFLISDKGKPRVLRATVAAILGAPGATDNGPALRFAR